MKIRFGLVLVMAIAFGVGGCASGGGGSSAGTDLASLMSGAGGEEVAQGYDPRNTESTRAAQQALENGRRADDPTQAQSEFERALAAAELAVREDSINPLGYRLAAEASLELENYQAAGEYFDHAEELRPIYQFENAQLREETWVELYQRAAPYIESGPQEYETAAKIYEDANAIYSLRPEAMIMLGQLQAALGQFDEAVATIDAALAIIDDPALERDEETLAEWKERAAPLPTVRAQSLYNAGRLEEAMADYSTLLVADPNNIQIKLLLGQMFIESGQIEEGFQAYEELLQDPGLSRTDFYAIGVGFYQGSAFGRAANAFRMAGERNRYDRDSMELWTTSLSLDSAYAAVPEAADRWIALDPNSLTARLVLLQALNQLEDNQDNQQRTAEVISEAEELEVDVIDLRITRNPNGGASLTGQVKNRVLDAGTAVTLTITFYSEEETPLGTLEQTVEVGEEDMVEVFAGEFDSAEAVGGYSYEVRVN